MVPVSGKDREMTTTATATLAGKPEPAAMQDGRALARAPGHWSFRPVSAHERPGIERFIREAFRRAYSARLWRFMPALMALRRNEEMAATCGLRPAAHDRLFLEVYLDQSVEAAVSAAAGLPVARSGIVEVGNLVIARPGFARSMITHLTNWLHADGTAWVVFSAVPALRNNFQRLGIPLFRLAAADGSRLSPDARAEWGSYYEQAPQVIAVKVDAAFAAVRSHA
jgi:hypothetical protein